MRTFPKLLFIVSLLLAVMSASGAQAQDMSPSEMTRNLRSCAGVDKNGQPLKPGDYGYMHKCLHEAYKKLYEKAKCHCHTGYCRPTHLRTHNGVRQVLISGHWYDVADEALRGRNKIPEELWHQPGHVCARPTGNTLSDGRPEQDTECVVDNATG